MYTYLLLKISKNSHFYPNKKGFAPIKGGRIKIAFEIEEVAKYISNLESSIIKVDDIV